MIQTVHEKSELAWIAQDKRGKHLYRPNCVSDVQKEQVRAHINAFGTVDSHYCRKDYQKRYLPSDLSVAKMYHMYQTKCCTEGIRPVTGIFLIVNTI